MWQRVRLASGLYRWHGITGAGWPRDVQHFNRCPNARRVLGRWSTCPNVNVARWIAASVSNAKRACKADS